MSNSDDNYFGVLLEDIRDQNKAVIESVSDIQRKVSNLPTREEFDELKQDVKVIKAAVTDQGKQQQDLERRVGDLETAR